MRMMKKMVKVMKNFSSSKMFTVSVAVRNSAFCTVKIASTLVFQNDCKEVFISLQVLLFVRRTSAGLKQALRPFREQERISWCA